MGTCQSEEFPHKTSVRRRPAQTVIKRLLHQENRFVDLRVWSVDLGALSGRLGEIVEMLEYRSVDIFWKVKEND